MSDTKKRALEYLESKPELTEIYATSDGFLFEKKYDATTHAKTLNEADPQVEVFVRKSKVKKSVEVKAIGEIEPIEGEIAVEQNTEQ